jgi:hypothetical protein
MVFPLGTPAPEFADIGYGDSMKTVVPTVCPRSVYLAGTAVAIGVNEWALHEF